MKTRSVLTRSLIAGALLASTSGTALAALDEIVITAEKREANLQTTAIAVSAFDAATMEDFGIAGAQDIANFTPGMSFSSQRIAIRGIGRLTQELGTEPGVATYQDGMYTAATTAVGAPAFLVDRIEVLRGPQGTLYGRNSIGGAANVISKNRPTNLKATLEPVLVISIGKQLAFVFQDLRPTTSTTWSLYLELKTMVTSRIWLDQIRA